MLSLSLQHQKDEINEYTRKLGYFFPNLQRKLLGAIATKIFGSVKKSLKKKVKSRTGGLASGLFKKNYATYSRVTFNGKQIGKANALESGTHILPKKRKVLTFKIDGRILRAKEVRVLPRKFFQEGTDNFINSPEMKKTLDKTVSDLIKKENLA